jgi:hypothetical protein
MKTKLHLSAGSFVAVVLWLFANVSVPSAFAQGTGFTYQGRLEVGTNAATGTYDLQFSLYTASTGGSSVFGPVTDTAVGVTNGLFTVFVDFGPGVFTGTTYWLGIGVRTNGTSSFSPLTPRQQVTPTPYAIYAETANAAGLSGSIPAGDLSGTYSSAVTLNNAGNSFTGNGGGLLNVNAALLGGLAASNFWQTTGNAGTSAGVNFIGTSDNEPLILRAYGETGLQLQYASASSGLDFSQSGINLIGGYWDNTISSGVVGGTIAGGGGSSRLGVTFFSFPNVVTSSFGTIGGGDDNTAGNYATVPGGVDNTASGLYSFAAGQQAQALNQGAFVWADSQGGTFASTANDQFLIRAQGGVGIGTPSPQQGLSVNTGMNLDQANLNGGFINNSNTNGAALTFGSSSGEGIASQRQPGTAANQYGLDFYTDFARRMYISQHGNVTVDNLLTVGGEYLEVDGLTPVDCYLGDDGSGNDVQIGSLKSGVTAVSCYNEADSAYMHLYCSSITIEGGSDLAEPFTITSGQDEVPQGAVVVIDEQNPGHLKLSDQSYDTRVAGVVSGANGINPGIQMQQLGLLEGGKNVALTGRVYVQADTSNGAIKPGDLLTTSSTPGHAMKVTDHARAAGAILGKAMTGLSEGKGMVLVLVTLQ